MKLVMDTGVLGLGELAIVAKDIEGGKVEQWIELKGHDGTVTKSRRLIVRREETFKPSPELLIHLLRGVVQDLQLMREQQLLFSIQNKQPSETVYYEFHPDRTLEENIREYLKGKLQD